MASQAYAARHRQGRLYGPVDRDLVLRTPFEVPQFTAEAHGSLREDVDWSRFERTPLRPLTLAGVHYAWNVERSTMGQVRAMVVGYTTKESRVAAFLTTWAYERHWIADAYRAVLEIHGVDTAQPVRHDNTRADRREVLVERALPTTDPVWTNLYGEDVVAAQTARGWAREAAMRVALITFARRSEHAELTHVLDRVLAIKTEHERFFADETRERLRRSPRAARLAVAALRRGFNPLRPVGVSRWELLGWLDTLAPDTASRRELVGRADGALAASYDLGSAEPLRRALERERRRARYPRA